MMIDIEDYMKLPLAERQMHLKLTTPCVFRNVKHRQECRGILAYVLDTTLPDKNIARICHACHVGECCNPLHLYWGTSSENCLDMHAADPTLRKRIGAKLKDSGHYERLGQMKRLNIGGNNSLRAQEKQQRIADIQLLQNYEITREQIVALSVKWKCTMGAAKKFITKYSPAD